MAPVRAPSLVAAAVALLLVADLAVTELAERTAARQLERSLCGEADVDLDGWPVSARLVAGRVPHVHASVDGARPEGLGGPITRLEVDARDVRLDGTSVASLGAGAFTATVADAEVGALVDLPVVVDRVEFADGRVVVHAVGGLEVPATVALEDDTVVVTPTLGFAAFPDLALRVPLDALPEGTTVTDVEVGSGMLVVIGTLDGAGLVTAPRTTPCP